ncbi:M-phase inducer phosphatase isoform X2 [Nasonia vitripennis]|uniref:SH2 domain-containing protein n=1 Tax=Nasonia vitripennis TaxID=7425 RepID=A0A7M7QBP0_NASVI|nr:M-phase inducer phosphatase isoform X2 [Nasonia vitripennis]
MSRKLQKRTCSHISPKKAPAAAAAHHKCSSNARRSSLSQRECMCRPEHDSPLSCALECSELPPSSVKAARQQQRGMRRFARRRRTLAAFTAIMGRIGRAAAGGNNNLGSSSSSHQNSSSSAGAKTSFKVHYRKLVEEHSPAKQQRRDEVRAQKEPQQLQIVPPLPDYMSYCCCRCGHTQKLKAEELNTIVGNAFRMAYVAQLQRQPMLQDVISSKSGSHFRKDSKLQQQQPQPQQQQQQQQETRGGAVWNKSLVGGDTAHNNNNNNSSSNNNNNNNNNNNKAAVGSSSSGSCSDDASSTSSSPTADDMNLQLGSAGSPTLRLSSVKTPNTIPGLRPSHNFGNVLSSLHSGSEDGCGTNKSISQQSTPSSDESNSPTELNSYKRLADKPPLIKRLAMGLTGGRDVLGLNGEDDSCPLVSGGSTPTSPTTTRPHSGGYINEAIIESDTNSSTTTTSRSSTQQQLQQQQHNSKTLPATENLDNTINSSINAKNFNIENNRLAQNSLNGATEADFKSKRRSQISTSSSSVPADGSMLGSTPTPPPLPERTDSLNNRSEEGELRRAPWFQAGIPREITLEVLSQEPEGAFMVRESTSKPGCYALSLRVPREFQPSGIAHYLIMRTNKGYKIKGFTKEFTTLTALITHHSVMPELLPCPLSLSRYNPSFVKTDSSKDFADIDSDPDYNTLADFRKMMADLNV